ncbi:sensor histidine kinase [Candidatus Xianfuyuplasma coldseepsis]|uniref:histidine kinase n=1 Tax=Candidatus Xianfuyuplasma coldseepsis TaxID=2782163 RepID=A0A7L7KQC1_9MOLU|nr:ATP-binding protein [Xianfuyuplasma coldseepsis]QMS84990.1 hypothetical protein G4Z02_04215 [Xianfuyuplasma coldseepsis]
MNINREYLAIAVGYLLVILYIAFINNAVINIILVLILLFVHLQVYTQFKKRLSQEKDTSVNKLQSRLEKTKRLQEEMAERFFSLSQSFGSGLLLVDEDGIIQYVNTDMTNYFGEIELDQDYQKVHTVDELHEFINKAYLIEAPMRKQVRHQGRSYDLISTPIFEANIFKGALILAHDITALKHAEEYQKRFTADVSHELRTPLSAIKGFGEILSRDGISADEQAEFIQLIRKEADRMEILLKDLTEISKLDRVDYELEKEQVSIQSLIEETVGVLKPRIKEKQLQVHVDIEDVNLDIDKNRMKQVLLNIIKNALSYTDEGSITITGNKEENRYKIAISDTGIGIKEEDFDKIFKRFYRVDKARSRDTGGSGLGLSISKNAVMKHGGTIHVSSALDQGTTFTIYLPL